MSSSGYSAVFHAKRYTSRRHVHWCWWTGFLLICQQIFQHPDSTAWDARSAGFDRNGWIHRKQVACRLSSESVNSDWLEIPGSGSGGCEIGLTRSSSHHWSHQAVRMWIRMMRDLQGSIKRNGTSFQIYSERDESAAYRGYGSCGWMSTFPE